MCTFRAGQAGGASTTAWVASAALHPVKAEASAASPGNPRTGQTQRSPTPRSRCSQERWWPALEAGRGTRVWDGAGQWYTWARIFLVDTPAAATSEDRAAAPATPYCQQFGWAKPSAWGLQARLTHSPLEPPTPEFLLGRRRCREVNSSLRTCRDQRLGHRPDKGQQQEAQHRQQRPASAHGVLQRRARQDRALVALAAQQRCTLCKDSTPVAREPRMARPAHGQGQPA